MRSRILRFLAALAVIGMLAAGGWYGYRAIEAQPIRRVVFAGDFERLPHAELVAFERALAETPPGVSVATVRAAARRISWVREATVRRRFPDAVEITFEAHEPLARWGEAALLSRRGEVFRAAFEGDLPRFRGPEGSGATMALRYPSIARALGPLGEAAELRLSARGAWQVVLASGLVLELGRGDTEARIARFAALWPHIAARGVESAHVDLRYPNGFAVQVGKKKNATT